MDDFGREINEIGTEELTKRICPVCENSDYMCRELLRDPVINGIASAHGKTAAQIIIRWHIQEDFSVIPGTYNFDYISENISVFDFSLSDEDMATLYNFKRKCF